MFVNEDEILAVGVNDKWLLCLFGLFVCLFVCVKLDTLVKGKS